jgi:molybdenum cofactor cytidylyltransferase
MSGGMNVTCVILAAGLSRRFGTNKLLEPGPRGQTLLERAVRACSAYPTFAVALRETGSALAGSPVHIVLNHEPDLGMSYSLKLANRIIHPAHCIAVLPADLAWIESDDVDAIASHAGEADVVFPTQSSGKPGHPVLFSPVARAGIASLHDGDTIWELRDREDFTRLKILRTSDGPFIDIDTPEQFKALELEGTGRTP